MKKYVRCKVCGFIMEEKDLKDVCPACGVPKTAFVDHKLSINEKRFSMLNLHLHPISVHFPEAIAVFLMGFVILSFIIPGNISEDLIIVNKTLSIFFPLTIILAFITGVYDAKLRFKKLSPPLLKIKIYLGITLFITSLITIPLIQATPYSTLIKIAIVAISIVNLMLSAVLGKLGGSLIDSQMPG